MDSASSRITRKVMIALAIAAAAAVTWLALALLLNVAPRGAASALLLLTALFLIVLILVQRGKGGGLAGAFGGLGGQSAFGTKAGDLFTRVTMGVALFWIILCMVTVGVLSAPQSMLQQGMGGAGPTQPGAAPAAADEEVEPIPLQPPPGEPQPLESPDATS